jgi:hypothetical protein
MDSESKPPSLDFGVLIAFVAPGFVAFAAASYQLDVPKAWMAAASDKEQNVGVFFFVLLASLSFGLVVSGIRALVIDRLLRWRRLGQHALLPLNLDWSKVDDKKLTLLVTVRDNFYRYYQFYANSLVSLILWLIARTFSDAPRLRWPFWVIAVLSAIALFLAARDSMQRYAMAVEQLMK